MRRTKNFLFTCLLFSAALLIGQSSIHQFTGVGINKELVDFSKFQGKKLLLVNTASYCSYTPQYAGLESLYTQYKQYGFEIVGFPCNDFGAQEPGKDSVINDFCTENYGVTFQMMSKVRIVAGDTAPIYKWLQRKVLNGVSNATVDWNFNKFLIDECGHWVAHYSSPVTPTSTLITNWIMSNACSVVGSAEIQNGSLLLVPPSSPSWDKLEFRVAPSVAASAEVELVSLYGQSYPVNLRQFVNGSGQVSYDISHYSPGIYMLRVTSAGKKLAYKFIVNP